MYHIGHSADFVNSIKHIDCFGSIWHTYGNIVTFFLGGRVDHDMQITVGGDVIEQMGRYKIDKLFLGMDGVDAVAGATSFNHVEDEIMCKMISQAKQKYLIVDDFKIGRQAFAHIADLTVFDGIITNYIPRLEEHYNAIRALGVNLIFAED